MLAQQEGGVCSSYCPYHVRRREALEASWLLGGRVRVRGSYDGALGSVLVLPAAPSWIENRWISRADPVQSEDF